MELPFSPEIPELETEARVHLTVISETLTVEEMTLIAKLEPDRSWSQGEPVWPGGREHRYNGVSWESRLEASRPIPEHLEDLLRRIDQGHARYSLAQLATHPRTKRADMWLALFEHERDNPSFQLSSWQMQTLGELKVGLFVDLYFFIDAGYQLQQS